MIGGSLGFGVWELGVFDQPPAIAPMIKKGSVPFAIASGNGCIRCLVRKIFATTKKTNERTAPLRCLVADRAAQDRVGCFERVEDGALRYRLGDLELHFVVNLRQRPQMDREHDSNHGSFAQIPIFKFQAPNKSKNPMPKIQAQRRLCMVLGLIIGSSLGFGL